MWESIIKIYLSVKNIVNVYRFSASSLNRVLLKHLFVSFFFVLIHPPLAFGKDLKWVISGAGPGGLATALSLIHSGVPANQIFVAESRVIDASIPNPFASNPYGSRRRSIILDDSTVKFLNTLGVKLHGIQLQSINFIHEFDVTKDTEISEAFATAVEKHEVDYNRGGPQITEGSINRKFSQVIAIGDLEQSLLKRFIELGGIVSFGKRAVITGQSDGIMAYLIDVDGTTEIIHAENAVIAEGKGSLSRTKAENSLLQVIGDNGATYLGADFSFSASQRNLSAAFVLFFDKNAETLGYGTSHQNGGSVGVIIPHDQVLKNRLSAKKYKTMLNEFVRQMGGDTKSITPYSIYDGHLFQSEYLLKNHIFFIGDSARTTDPISGNGANVAIRDAMAIGRFASLNDSAPDRASERVVREIQNNTLWSLEGSLFFQSLVQYCRENSSRAKMIFRQFHNYKGSTSPLMMNPFQSITSTLLGIAPPNFIKHAVKLGFNLAQVPTPPTFGEPNRLSSFEIHPHQNKSNPIQCSKIFSN